MAINKVKYGLRTLIDLTEDTVTPETLMEGVTAHNKAGEVITGVYKANNSNDVLRDLIEGDIVELEIPEGTTKIGDYVFMNYNTLTSVSIPDSVTSIGNSSFFNCPSLANITIPNSVISIGTSAFGSCTSLTNIIIPDSVTSIGTNIFAYCSSLTSVTISNGVTSIGNNAFQNCTSLTNLILTRTESVVTLSGIRAFRGTPETLKIYVPDALVESYKTATNWSSFASQIYPMSELPSQEV